MFNPDFYPTPPEVIDYMLSGIEIQDRVILEPSAGKGNIVDALKTFGAKQVLTYEMEPDLQTIVSNKSKFLGSDFLTAKKEELSHINAIIANPPFSVGGRHILHMWEIAPEGCEIVALCNTNTLRKDFSRERRELNKLVENYGKSEDLGDCFSISERKTGVEVSLIRLFKPLVSEDANWDGFFMDEEEEVVTGPGIMPHNEVRSIVNRYVGAVKCFDEYAVISEKMNRLLQPIGIKDNFSCSVNQGKTVSTKEDFSKDLQKTSWSWIFKQMKIEKYVTSGVLKDINKFVEDQQQYPFTMKNIYRMFEIIVGTRKQTMDRAIIEIFDKVTMHYHDNRYNVEGWKTNSHYLVGKKFIFPYMISVGYHGQIDTGYRSENTMDDLNKVLCFLTGKDFDSMLTFYQRLKMKNMHLAVNGNIITDKKRAEMMYESPAYTYNNPYDFTDETLKVFLETCITHDNYQVYYAPVWGQWAEWDFFEFKCYKKGTIHFKFKDENVWALFNRKVAEIKGFPLPEKL